METGIDVKKVREEIDREDWEDDTEYPGRQTRRIYLGSWTSLSPSGKTYMPWAHSNVDGCAGCNGTGKIRCRVKSRVQKKRRAREKVRLLWVKRYGPAIGGGWPLHVKAKSKHLHKLFRALNTQCQMCGGEGSREAYLDEQWVELVTKELEAEGLHYDPDGDDLFVSEYRDDPEDDAESVDFPVETGVESGP